MEAETVQPGPPQSKVVLFRRVMRWLAWVTNLCVVVIVALMWTGNCRTNHALWAYGTLLAIPGAVLSVMGRGLVPFLCAVGAGGVAFFSLCL